MPVGELVACRLATGISWRPVETREAHRVHHRNAAIDGRSSRVCRPALCRLRLQPAYVGRGRTLPGVQPADRHIPARLGTGAQSRTGTAPRSGCAVRLHSPANHSAARVHGLDATQRTVLDAVGDPRHVAGHAQPVSGACAQPCQLGAERLRGNRRRPVAVGRPRRVRCAWNLARSEHVICSARLRRVHRRLSCVRPDRTTGAGTRAAHATGPAGPDHRPRARGTCTGHGLGPARGRHGIARPSPPPLASARHDFVVSGADRRSPRAPDRLSPAAVHHGL